MEGLWTDMTWGKEEEPIWTSQVGGRHGRETGASRQSYHKKQGKEHGWQARLGVPATTEELSVPGRLAHGSLARPALDLCTPWPGLALPVGLEKQNAVS